MRKIIPLILILSIFFAFYSCTTPLETVPTLETVEEYVPLPVPDFIDSVFYPRYCIFEDYYITFDGAVAYRKLDSEKMDLIRISDSTIFGDDYASDASINGRVRYDLMLVDIEETNKNNGVPVLLIACSKLYTASSGQHYFESGGIKCINLDTCEVREVQTDIPSQITDMCLYKDTIFYITQDGFVHQVNRDGAAHKSVDLSNSYGSIFSIQDDKVYISHRVNSSYDNNQEVLMCDLNFSEFVKMPGEVSNLQYVCGEYIYYCKYIDKDLNFYRRKLSEFENTDYTEELIAENVAFPFVSQDKFFYYLSEEKENETDERNSLFHAYDMADSEDLGIVYVNEEKDTKKRVTAAYSEYLYGIYTLKHPISGIYNENIILEYVIINLETGKEKIFIPS